MRQHRIPTREAVGAIAIYSILTAGEFSPIIASLVRDRYSTALEDMETQEI